MIYVDPKKAIHPLRTKLGEDGMAEIVQGIADDQDWMSLEEIEAAQDYIYDVIVAKKQTHLGITTLQ